MVGRALHLNLDDAWQGEPRLSDAPWDEQANFEFAATCMEPASVTERFLRSPLIKRIWPEALSRSRGTMKSLFAVRETRFLSETDFIRQPTTNEFNRGLLG